MNKVRVGQVWMAGQGGPLVKIKTIGRVGNGDSDWEWSARGNPGENMLLKNDWTPFYDFKWTLVQDVPDDG